MAAAVDGFNEEPVFPFSADFSGSPIEWPVYESFMDNPPMPNPYLSGGLSEFSNLFNEEMITKDELLFPDFSGSPMQWPDHESFMDNPPMPNPYLSECQQVPSSKTFTGFVNVSRELGAVDKKKKARKVIEEHLTKTIISQFFYMPIEQTAKELNISTSSLKKRCRELDIQRWPHRKLTSLQTLINNVQELWKEEGQGSEEKLKMLVEVLERERKLMEELPDMQIEEKTKKLRQACLMANYKKKKMMVVDVGGSNGAGSSA